MLDVIYVQLCNTTYIPSACYTAFFYHHRGGQQGGVNTPGESNVVMQYVMIAVVDMWELLRYGVTIGDHLANHVALGRQRVYRH